MNIEDQITIDQGVYGLLISGCDGCQDQPAAGEQVVVYGATANGPISQGKSDDDGVYQIDLVEGDYTVCLNTCTAVTVTANDKVRLDWVSGPGGGHWSN